MESRLYWSRRALFECEEPGVRKGPAGTRECLADAETRVRAMGWVLAIPIPGWDCWVGSTSPPTHPVLHVRQALRALLALRTPGSSGTQLLVPTCCTAVLRSTKEILGVGNARATGTGTIPPRTALPHAPHCSLAAGLMQYPVSQYPVSSIQ